MKLYICRAFNNLTREIAIARHGGGGGCAYMYTSLGPKGKNKKNQRGAPDVAAIICASVAGG